MAEPDDKRVRITGGLRTFSSVLVRAVVGRSRVTAGCNIHVDGGR